MALSVFDDRSHQPDDEELAGALAATVDLWNELRHAIGARFAPVSATWGFSSKSTGWGLRLKDATFQQLVIAYQNTVLRANAEVENSLVGFLKAQQSVKFLATSTEAAAQSLGMVRLQYREGLTDFNRVLSVEQLLTQQEDQLAVARGAVAKNLILVYKSIGGGWQIRLGPETPVQMSGAPSGEVVPPPAAIENAPLPQPPAVRAP